MKLLAPSLSWEWTEPGLGQVVQLQRQEPETVNRKQVADSWLVFGS